MLCSHYFSPLDTLMRQGKDPEPDPSLWLTNPDPAHCVLQCSGLEIPVRGRWQRRPEPPDCPWRRRPQPGSAARPPQSGPRCPHWSSAEKWMVPVIHSLLRIRITLMRIRILLITITRIRILLVTLIRMQIRTYLHFDAVPDPIPDPSFQIKAKVLK